MGLFGTKKPKHDQLEEHLGRTGEVVLVRSADWVLSGEIVVTDQRSLFVDKGRIAQDVAHQDVVETEIRRVSKFFMVLINAPGQQLQVHVRTGDVARDICREIDMRMGPVRH